MTRMKTVQEFIAGLRGIVEDEFDIPRVAAYTERNPVDPDSLQPYLFYEPTHYRRNLIFTCELSGLLAVGRRRAAPATGEPEAPILRP